MSLNEEILQPLSESELSPLVLILSPHQEEFSHFETALKDSGFNTQYLADISQLISTAQSFFGSIIFLSWEYSSFNLKKLETQLSYEYGATCIIFAEKDNIQTRAEMTSLGFENTIQPPFSQKNFIMAVQKIVSDRKEENEKRLRRLNHHQRKSTPMSAKQEFVNHEDFYQEGQPNSSSRQTEHFVQPGFTPSHQHHQGSAEGPHLQLVHTEAEAEQELLAGLAEEGLEGLDDLIHEEQVEQFMDQLEEDSLEGDNIEGFEEETLDYSQFQSEFQASAESQGKESHTEQLIPLPHELINEPIPHLNSNPHHSNTAQYYETSFTQKDWVLMLGGIGIGLIMCFYFLSQVFLSALLQ